jgi:calcium/calmodulin-dependent protein kinase I
MMKLIDKIKNHGQENEAAAAEKAIADRVAAEKAAAAAERKRERERGPRIHPELLELYEITDHVLGVGTFATVKEIKLRSTGKQKHSAFFIMDKKDMLGDRKVA